MFLARVGVLIGGRRRPEYLVQNDKVHGSRGCVFSIEVTRRKEDVKEKENVWRKVMMQKKERVHRTVTRTKKLSKEKKLSI